MNTDAEGRVTKLAGDEVVSMNMWDSLPRCLASFMSNFRSFLN